MDIKIGNVELKHGLFLAPMAGYSDRAMRVVCREAGAEYAVTEMVSAKAIVFGDKKTVRLARIKEDEGPVALQIFGSEPDTMARAAEMMQNGCGEGFVAPSAIDINMGCPVPKIFNNGEGSALMRSPDLIYKIVKSVKENIALPVTVKLRAGINKESINAVECALAAEAGGAALVCIHGRTRVEMYSGKADREIIKNVKQSLHIPVVANGDITSGEEAISMLSETGADGIAIGRGAVGNPFIFKEITAALEEKEYTVPSFGEIIQMALCQLRLSVADKGERVAVPEARKQIASYLSSFRGAAEIRGRINQSVSYTEIEKILLDALDRSLQV